jgi:transcription factor E2F3
MFESSLGACTFKINCLTHVLTVLFSNFEMKSEEKLDKTATLASHTHLAKRASSMKGPRTKRAGQSCSKEVVVNAQQIHKTPDLNAPYPSEGVLRKITPSDVDVS